MSTCGEHGGGEKSMGNTAASESLGQGETGGLHGLLSHRWGLQNTGPIDFIHCTLGVQTLRESTFSRYKIAGELN
jgi:hypothetical protein